MLLKVARFCCVRWAAVCWLIMSAVPVWSTRFDHVPNVTTTCFPAVHSSSASITCHFSQDLRQTMHSVTVVAIERRELNNSYVKHSVVECFWRTVDTFDCKAHPGYRTNEQISDSFSAVIPNYTNYFHGTYTCFVKSSLGESKNKQCLLDGNTVDLGPLVEGDPNAWKTSVGAIVGVLVTLTVAVAAVAIWLYRRRRRTSQIFRFSTLSDSNDALT